MSLESLSINDLGNIDEHTTVNKFPTKRHATDGSNSATKTSRSKKSKPLASVAENWKEQNWKNWKETTPPSDWREQMKAIISKNLQHRDAYADKHETLSAKPRRGSQSKLYRPEEPTVVTPERTRALVSSGRATHAGSASSMGQFYCAPPKTTRKKMIVRKKMVVSGDRAERPRRPAPRVHTSDRSARRTYRTRSLAAAKASMKTPAKPRFPCILLANSAELQFRENAKKSRAKVDRSNEPSSRRDWGETLSAMCLDQLSL